MKTIEEKTLNIQQFLIKELKRIDEQESLYNGLSSAIVLNAQEAEDILDIINELKDQREKQKYLAKENLELQEKLEIAQWSLLDLRDNFNLSEESWERAQEALIKISGQNNEDKK